MPQIARCPAGCVRRAARAEIAEIVPVMMAAYAQYRDCVPAVVFDAYLEDLRHLGDRWDEAEVLVAEHDGRIAGTVCFYSDASREGMGLPRGWAGFRMLAVHPSARGVGLGRKLTQRCIDMARDIGSPTIGIHTAAFMAAACAIYERAGFRRCPEYDLRATEILAIGGADREVAVIAYRLDLGHPAA